jgi:hypothetical protein
MRLRLLHKSVDVLLMSLLIFSAGGLLFVYNRDVSSYALMALGLISILFLGKKMNRLIFKTSIITFMFFLTVFMLNYFAAIGDQSFIKYGYYLLSLISSLLVIVHFKNNRDEVYVSNLIKKVLVLIMLHSVFNFIAYFFVKDSLFSIETEVHHTETFNYLFYYNPNQHSFSLFGLDLVRNQGLFWEPGITQIFLNILLYLEGVVLKKSKWVMLFTVAAILTTYSTTGILIMLVILLYIFRMVIRKKPILLALGLALIVPFNWVVKKNLEEKVYGEQSSSFQKRLFDIKQPLLITIDNPLTGVGLDKEQFQTIRSGYYLDLAIFEEIEREMGVESTIESTDMGISNSIMALLSTMGIPVTFIFLWFLFKQQIFLHSRRLISFIIFIFIMSEPLLLRPFFLTLIVSGAFAFFYQFSKQK